MIESGEGVKKLEWAAVSGRKPIYLKSEPNMDNISCKYSHNDTRFLLRFFNPFLLLGLLMLQLAFAQGTDIAVVFTTCMVIFLFLKLSRQLVT